MENRTLDPVIIGERLRVLRGIRTQGVVSEGTGLSQARISNYEHGLRIPNDDAKIALANFFGVTVQDLFYTSKYNVK